MSGGGDDNDNDTAWTTENYRGNVLTKPPM
jgi:hypothetical protein